MLAVLAAALVAREVHAQVACSTLPNPVVLQVGDTQQPLLKNLGRRLADSETHPITLIYVTSGSCTNIDAIYAGTKITANPLYVPSTVQDRDWTPSMTSPTCTNDTVGGLTVDVANSALFVSACPSGAPPPGIGAFTGPNQPYVFVVPEGSSQTAITAEEAYFVFGFGAAGQILPWLDEAFFFIRPITKSTLLALAAAIRVPGARWKGTPLESSTLVVNAVATSAMVERTIGILGAEVYDVNRATLNSLAFRSWNQFFAYYPDSTAAATDKANVRDGHYVPWSPTVYLAPVDAGGVPTHARAKTVIDMIVGNPLATVPDFDPLAVVIGRGLVPGCAMKVSREFEGGDLTPYEAPEPCGCFFEDVLGDPGPGCTACSDETPCATGVCRHGYCEVR